MIRPLIFPLELRGKTLILVRLGVQEFAGSALMGQTRDVDGGSHGRVTEPRREQEGGLNILGRWQEQNGLRQGLSSVTTFGGNTSFYFRVSVAIKLHLFTFCPP